MSLGGATPALPAEGWTWKIYRTLTNASYVNSYLHHVVEETFEGSGITAVTHIDTGGSTMVGQPPAAAPAIGSPTKVLLTGGAEVQGLLPLANIDISIPFVITFMFSGTLFPQDGLGVWVCDFPEAEILGVRATLGRDSVAAATDVIVDVKKWMAASATPSWTSIFSSNPNRPHVLVGEMFGDRVVPQTIGLVENDALVVDILQAGGGATPTDADMVVNIYMQVSG